MIGEPYPIRDQEFFKEQDTLFLHFISDGHHAINKLVAFTPVHKNGIKYYNWGFGDIVANNGIAIDDESHTNNGDTKRVFYTVVSTLSLFFEIHPLENVLIQGSDKRRMKVYQSLIFRHWNDIIQLYEIKMSKDDMIN